MKKPSVWAGIFGGLITAMTLIQGAQFLANPTDIFKVNLALALTQLAWLVFGAYLLYLFVQLRGKEDVNVLPTKPELGTPEDVERLSTQRRWVITFVLIAVFIGSLQSWILNDYFAGLTLINFGVTFDLVFNIFFAFVVIQLIRNKQEILTPFLYAVVVYGVVEMLVQIALERYMYSIVTLLFTAFFVFAIKAPLTRLNHRIAHLVMLPIFVIVSIAAGYVENIPLNETLKKDALLSQQFLNDSSSVGSAFVLFLQKQTPDKTDMQNVILAKKNLDERIEEIFANFEVASTELQSQIPNVQQQETLERIQYLKEIIMVSKEQADKVEAMMQYALTLNFNYLSAEELETLSRMKVEIDSYTNKITEAQFKLNNANLVY